MKKDVKEMKKNLDNYAIVLDYIPPGLGKRNYEPIVHAIGESTLRLLEIVLKEGCFVAIQDKIYIGPEKRDIVKFVKRRIRYDELSSSAKQELEYVLLDMIKNKEKEFVEFFNKAKMITPKRHELELLPGIGKRTLQKILEEREKEPFKSFKDIEERTGIKNVEELIKNRIIIELSEREKYYLFVKTGQRPPINRTQQNSSA